MTPEHTALVAALEGHALPSGGEYLTMCERAVAAIRALSGENETLRKNAEKLERALMIFDPGLNSLGLIDKRDAKP